MTDAPSSFTSSTSGRHNLILLTVDAWRADFADSHAGVPLLPALDAVADRTVRFGRCYANGPWTTPPLVSLFTGESPARHQVAFEWSVPRPGGPALAARLQQHGYAVPNLCYLNRLGNYQNLGYAAADAPDYPHDADDDTLLRAVRARRNQPAAEPFFLWFHYKFVHLPYWAAAPYRQRLGIDDDAIPQRLRESVCSGFVVPRGSFRLLPQDRDLCRRLYAAGVLQFNDFLARLLAELWPATADGVGQRTTLVLTADHGEELLDHGHVGHASTAHHAILHDEVLRIPLIVVDPRIQKPRTIATRVQGMDLFPTLLSLAGVPAPEGPDSPDAIARSEGLAAFDLAPAILAAAEPPAGALLPPDDRIFYFHSARLGYLTPRDRESHVIEAISDGTTKFIAERYDTPQLSLYDLAADPAESSPLASAAAGADGAPLSGDDRLLAAAARLLHVRAALRGPAV